MVLNIGAMGIHHFTEHAHVQNQATSVPDGPNKADGTCEIGRKVMLESENLQ